MAIVQTGGYFGHVDKTGKVVVTSKFINVLDFVGSLAFVRFDDGYTGYVDKTGKTVWKSKYLRQEIMK